MDDLILFQEERKSTLSQVFSLSLAKLSTLPGRPWWLYCSPAVPIFTHHFHIRHAHCTQKPANSLTQSTSETFSVKRREEKKKNLEIYIYQDCFFSRIFCTFFLPSGITDSYVGYTWRWIFKFWTTKREETSEWIHKCSSLYFFCSLANIYSNLRSSFCER